MIGLPPIGISGIKAPQARDKPRPKRAFVGHDLELTDREMQGAEAIKIAWAEEIADAPKMLMGRDPATGRFYSLKKSANG